MPGIVITTHGGAKGYQIRAIHETLYSAKEDMLRRMGNPELFYCVREIPAELYQQLCTIIKTEKED